MSGGKDKGVPAAPSRARPAGGAAKASPAKPSPANAFKRSVTFSPSFNRLNETPNYGIAAVRIRFVLKGELGAVQWMIGTEWFVASAIEHLRKFPRSDLREYCRPTGWDLGYHSPRPLYEGQEPMGQCDVLSGGCYYDGSGCNADLLIENFLAQGDDYVWRALEAYYRCTFEDAAWPFDESGNIISDTGK